MSELRRDSLIRDREWGGGLGWEGFVDNGVVVLLLLGFLLLLLS